MEFFIGGRGHTPKKSVTFTLQEKPLCKICCSFPLHVLAVKAAQRTVPDSEGDPLAACLTSHLVTTSLLLFVTSKLGTDVVRGSKTFKVCRKIGKHVSLTNNYINFWLKPELPACPFQQSMLFPSSWILSKIATVHRILMPGWIKVPWHRLHCSRMHILSLNPLTPFKKKMVGYSNSDWWRDTSYCVTVLTGLTNYREWILKVFKIWQDSQCCCRIVSSPQLPALNPPPVWVNIIYSPGLSF